MDDRGRKGSDRCQRSVVSDQKGKQRKGIVNGYWLIVAGYWEKIRTPVKCALL